MVMLLGAPLASREHAQRLCWLLSVGTLADVVDELKSPTWVSLAHRSAQSPLNESGWDGMLLTGCAATAPGRALAFRLAVVALLFELGADPLARGEDGRPLEWVFETLEEAQGREWCAHELKRARRAWTDRTKYQLPPVSHPEQPPAKRQRTASPLPDYDVAVAVEPVKHEPQEDGPQAAQQYSSAPQQASTSAPQASADQPAWSFPARAPPPPQYAAAPAYSPYPRLSPREAFVFKPLILTLRELYDDMRRPKWSQVGSELRARYPDVFQRDMELSTFKRYVFKAEALGIIAIGDGGKQGQEWVSLKVEPSGARSASPQQGRRPPPCPPPPPPLADHLREVNRQISPTPAPALGTSHDRRPHTAATGSNTVMPVMGSAAPKPRIASRDRLPPADFGLSRGPQATSTAPSVAGAQPVAPEVASDPRVQSASRLPRNLPPASTTKASMPISTAVSDGGTSAALARRSAAQDVQPMQVDKPLSQASPAPVATSNAAVGPPSAPRAPSEPLANSATTSRLPSSTRLPPHLQRPVTTAPLPVDNVAAAAAEPAQPEEDEPMDLDEDEDEASPPTPQTAPAAPAIVKPLAAWPALRVPPSTAATASTIRSPAAAAKEASGNASAVASTPPASKAPAFVPACAGSQTPAAAPEERASSVPAQQAAASVAHDANVPVVRPASSSGRLPLNLLAKKRPSAAGVALSTLEEKPESESYASGASHAPQKAGSPAEGQAKVMSGSRLPQNLAAAPLRRSTSVAPCATSAAPSTGPGHSERPAVPVQRPATSAENVEITATATTRGPSKGSGRLPAGVLGGAGAHQVKTSSRLPPGLPTGGSSGRLPVKASAPVDSSQPAAPLAATSAVAPPGASAPQAPTSSGGASASPAPAAPAHAVRRQAAPPVEMELHNLPSWMTQPLLKHYLVHGPSTFSGLTRDQVPHLEQLVHEGHFDGREGGDVLVPLMRRVELIPAQGDGVSANVKYATRASAEQAKALFGGRRIVEAIVEDRPVTWLDKEERTAGRG
ncbi:hypothetical protein Rhopal_004852-T1 [Rhodotorula paludigena]|uniref:Proteophosphoglycan ppg4 n=1 Tax=Rhodotorula paludigena TaxID=86838 RepID=A0AAV5GPH6_9BASI|nr:hypothetical protein Rhopal_004852-T1 [Rhodotorula paludigena]